ncbi:unnamed protein product [Ixodes hexagonus]
MRRDNLFISQKKGGLGLVNVELKGARFCFFRDQSDPLVVSAFKELGGRFFSPWLDGDTGESRAHVLKFYREIAAAKEFFQTRFSDDYLKKVKKRHLYWDTIDLIMPPPLYRGMSKTVVKSDVFHRLRRYPVRTAIKNFFLRFHFEVLPVKTWLVKKGFFAPWSTNCALCPSPETLEHVFLYCTNAELFWAELRAVLKVDI